MPNGVRAKPSRHKKRYVVPTAINNFDVIFIHCEFCEQVRLHLKNTTALSHPYYKNTIFQNSFVLIVRELLYNLHAEGINYSSSSCGNASRSPFNALVGLKGKRARHKDIKKHKYTLTHSITLCVCVICVKTQILFAI